MLLCSKWHGDEKGNPADHYLWSLSCLIKAASILNCSTFPLSLQTLQLATVLNAQVLLVRLRLTLFYPHAPGSHDSVTVNLNAHNQDPGTELKLSRHLTLTVRPVDSVFCEKGLLSHADLVYLKGKSANLTSKCVSGSSV